MKPYNRTNCTNCTTFHPISRSASWFMWIVFSYIKRIWVLFLYLSLLSGSYFLGGCQKPALELVQIESLPSEAKLFIDDQFIGLTPLHIELESGRSYQVELKKKNFYRYRIVKVLEGSHTFSLVPIEKELTLQISPRPTSLFINDQKINVANNSPRGSSRNFFIYKGNFQYGPLKISAFKSGFPILKKTLVVEDKTPEKLNFKFEILPYPTQVFLKSTPSESSVFYEGHLIGKTPLILKNLPVQTHHFKFEKALHEVQTRTFTLSKYEKKTIGIALKKAPLLSTVIFSGLPRNAAVSIKQIRTFNDKPCKDCLGTTLNITPDTTNSESGQLTTDTLTTRLIPGTYRYEIHTPIAYTKTGTFSIAPGSTHAEEVNVLKRLPTNLFPSLKYSLASFTPTGAFWYKKTLYLIEKHNPTFLTYTPLSPLINSYKEHPTQLTSQQLQDINSLTLRKILKAMIDGNGNALHQSIETVSYALLEESKSLLNKESGEESIYIFDNIRHQISRLDKDFQLQSQISLLSCLSFPAFTLRQPLPLISGQAIVLPSYRASVLESNSRPKLETENELSAMILTDLANEITTELTWNKSDLKRRRTYARTLQNSGSINNCQPLIREGVQPLRGRGLAMLSIAPSRKTQNPIELIWIAEEQGQTIKVYTRTGTFVETLKLFPNASEKLLVKNKSKNKISTFFNSLFSSPTNSPLSTPVSENILYLFIPNEDTLITLNRQTHQTLEAKSSAHKKKPLENSLYVYSLQSLKSS